MPINKTVNTFVLTQNSEGAPEIIVVEVACSQSQYDEGEHYDLALEAADEEGFEALEAFDEFDPAGRVVDLEKVQTRLSCD